MSNVSLLGVKKYLRICLVLSHLCISSCLYGAGPNLNCYVELGEKSTEEAIQNGSTLDYGYSKYYLRWEIPATKKNTLAFVVSSYLKKYETERELDNATVAVKSYWDYFIFERRYSSLKLDFDLGWREKNYKEKEVYSNRQWISKIGWAYSRKDFGKVRGEVGYRTYDYFVGEDKDRKELSERVEVERYLWGRQIEFLGALQFRQTDFCAWTDTKQFIYRLGIGIKPALIFFSQLEGRFEEGKEYTDEELENEEEDREGDYYFRYQRWWVETKHPFTERIYTVLKCTSYEKDYAHINYDHRWYQIENWWKCMFRKSRKSGYTAGFGYLYRDTEYNQKENASYTKNQMHASLELSWKEDIKLASDFGTGKDDYILGRDKDKKTYWVGLEFGKQFVNRRLALVAACKWKVKDYELKEDKEQRILRFSANYKF